MHSSHSTRRSRTGAALAAVGLAALAGVTTSVSPAAARPGDRHGPVVTRFSGELTDLLPATAGPFDGAGARLLKVEHGSASTFVLQVWGVDPAVAGQDFGAHLHTGPCVSGNGAMAGPHYNASVAAGVQPPVVSNRTEVWLDVTITAHGRATAVTTVPFVVPPGQRSIVFHAMPTDDHGTAGPRQACLPVSWS